MLFDLTKMPAWAKRVTTNTQDISTMKRSARRLTNPLAGARLSHRPGLWNRNSSEPQLKPGRPTIENSDGSGSKPALKQRAGDEHHLPDPDRRSQRGRAARRFPDLLAPDLR